MKTHVLQSEVTQPGMIVRPAALRPAEFSLFFSDRHIVDAGMPDGHVALGVEFPVFVCV